ncbi:hypothetical protein C474_00105 [Halogeometricum pallidum JCM 14848]|uniref:Uncharacterized protein n=1 Tax=Halogeometricum pallidum JCM 14848 TaxID=1227487 RepID=M0DIK9_HALPD|nr:hypothetical protein [Halogeometricum pallidum]ELZ35305.1 hypothetical protein C474_00105 [Halogeometricum pallidum JCM 14848]
MTGNTPAETSAREETADDGNSESDESHLRTAARDVARHWQAAAFAVGSLAVAYWAAFLQPSVSPKWYVPIMLGYAALAVGYILVTEEFSLNQESRNSNA